MELVVHEDVAPGSPSASSLLPRTAAWASKNQTTKPTMPVAAKDNSPVTNTLGAPSSPEPAPPKRRLITCQVFAYVFIFSKNLVYLS